MALLDSITTFVNTALAQRHATVRADKIDQLYNSGELYLDSGNVLCVKARSATIANLEGQTLPTRITASAKSTLDSLRELVNTGLVEKSVLHDQDTGVTVQVIP